MESPFSIVYAPQSDAQELFCAHEDCKATDKPFKVWNGVSVDYEELRKEVQLHTMNHLTEGFKKLLVSFKAFMPPSQEEK